MQVRNASNTPEGDGFYASKNMERYGRILNMEKHEREKKCKCYDLHPHYEREISLTSFTHHNAFLRILTIVEVN